jgi:hypothetical protein
MPRSSSLKAAAASSFHRLFIVYTPDKKLNYWWSSEQFYFLTERLKRQKNIFGLLQRIRPTYLIILLSPIYGGIFPGSDRK